MMDPEVQEVPVAPEVVVLDSDEPGSNKEAPMPRQDDPLENLEKALENACSTITSFAASVMNFSYENQDLLYTKANEYVKDLREVDEKSKAVDAVIPMEVIEAIDKGRNPEHCTYQMLESCAEANNVSRGKLQAMRSFRDELEKALAEPEEQPKPVENTEADQAKKGSGALPNNGLHSVPAGNGTTNGY